LTISLRALGVGAVVLDIEGTTTPISFVHDVLFPYARVHLQGYLDERRDSADLAEVVSVLREEWDGDAAASGLPAPARRPPDESPESLAAYVDWLMQRDRKSPGLKLLQGQIWKRGYDDGTLRGDVYPDVPAALARWHEASVSVAIYSSGSALAQELLFGCSIAGDLTRFLDRFFDTAVGGKREARSYERIAQALGLPAPRILFVSDVVEELAPSTAAGMRGALCVRPGNPPPAGAFEPTIRSFEEIEV
jgi:2,3-diketo-5-methylthio-1-phosphopentane phosphatase